MLRQFAVMFEVDAAGQPTVRAKSMGVAGVTRGAGADEWTIALMTGASNHVLVGWPTCSDPTKTMAATPSELGGKAITVSAVDDLAAGTFVAVDLQLVPKG